MKYQVKRKLGYMLVIAMLITMIYPGEMGTAAEINDGFYVEDGTLVQYVGAENAVEIPESVEKIGESAFLNTTITSVEIPTSVTSIEENAFSGCEDLKEVTIPSSVEEVGENVFYGCISLDKVVWKSDAGIPNGAFKECIGLSELELSTGLLSIGEEAFKGCEALVSFAVPEATKEIADDAFDGCINMEAIDVDEKNTYYTSYEGMLYSTNWVTLYRCPEGARVAKLHEKTKMIAENAFYGCNLGTVTLPESVLTVSDGAFEGCEIQKLIVGEKTETFGAQDTSFNIHSMTVAPNAPVAEQLLEEYGEIVDTDYQKPEEPGDTEDPGNTEEPGNTEQPGDTEQPGNTEQPGDTEQPGNTEQPSNTEQPGNTPPADNGNSGNTNNGGGGSNNGGGANNSGNTSSTNNNSNNTSNNGGSSSNNSGSSGGSTERGSSSGNKNYSSNKNYSTGSNTNTSNNKATSTNTQNSNAGVSSQTQEIPEQTVEPSDNSVEQGTAYIAGETEVSGWDNIYARMQASADGETICIIMNGTTIVPENILRLAAEKNLVLVLDMGNGIKWTLRGKDIITEGLGDVDFAVTLGAGNVPQELQEDVADDSWSTQMHLAHEGVFGLSALLSVNIGAEHAGKNATLFYYDEAAGALKYIDMEFVKEGGVVTFSFEHASDYVIVLDGLVDNFKAESMEGTTWLGTTGTPGEGSEQQNSDTTDENTNDENINSSEAVTEGGGTGLDDTPPTGQTLNPKYILCLGVMLLGIYMILTSKKEEKLLDI